MNITIINDCRDANALGRQVARASSLIEGGVSFVGVSSDLEAAGNLIDILDAYGDAPAAVLVNVAPRHGKAKKWKNGTPFGYFWYRNILVVASIDGLTLSLVKKLGLIKVVKVLDIPTVIGLFVKEGVVSAEVGAHIVDTQFRSFDFVPRLAAYLLQHKEVVSEEMQIADIEDAPKAVWWIDNFGNCKTTLIKEDLAKEGKENTDTKLTIGTFPYFERLKDVPDKQKALITGSSGLGPTRFLEVTVQGISAAKEFSLSSGDLLL